MRKSTIALLVASSALSLGSVGLNVSPANAQLIMNFSSGTESQRLESFREAGTLKVIQIGRQNSVEPVISCGIGCVTNTGTTPLTRTTNGVDSLFQSSFTRALDTQDTGFSGISGSYTGCPSCAPKPFNVTGAATTQFNQLPGINVTKPTVLQFEGFNKAK
jgi:hypothetical protein